MQDRSLKAGAIIALATIFGAIPSHVALAGSDHGVRVHRLMKPSPKPAKPRVQAETKAAKTVKPHRHNPQRVVVFVSDEGPYSRRYIPNRRPWSESRSPFLNDSHREFQNPPGLYSSQLNRAFD